MLNKIKILAKQTPLIDRLYYLAAKLYHLLQVKIKISSLKKKSSRKFANNPSSKLIVSLTSFPARIENTWITVESLFNQDYKPAKIVLVLCETEFPGKTIPRTLENQVQRGLEIIWVDENIRSYKKLLPTIIKYPEYDIITVDDDIIYEPWRIKGLIEAQRKYPDSIIGYRGWEVQFLNGKLEPYVNWPKASLVSQPYLTLLTGVGGILYPSHLLNTEMLLDIKTAQILAPTADDIWFWAVARISNIPVICLGYERHLQIKLDDKDNELYTINCLGGRNDEQLLAVIESYQINW